MVNNIELSWEVADCSPDWGRYHALHDHDPGMALSAEACRIAGCIYDRLLAQYHPDEFTRSDTWYHGTYPLSTSLSLQPEEHVSHNLWLPTSGSVLRDADLPYVNQDRRKAEQPARSVSACAAAQATQVSPAGKEVYVSLNILCIRLIFCLFADDSGIFSRKGMFRDFVRNSDTRYLHLLLAALFIALNTRPVLRSS